MSVLRNNAVARCGKAGLAAVLLFLAPTVAMAGEPETAQARRFVEAVQAGGDRVAADFPGVVSSEDAAAVTALSACTPGEPRVPPSGTSGVILWDCEGKADKATLLSFEGGKLTSALVVSAVIVPTK